MRTVTRFHILLVLVLLLPPAAAISRDAYLQQVAKTSAIVAWVGQAGTVEYGTALGQYTQSATATSEGSSAAGAHWAARITGLTPGTKYYYQVKEGGTVPTLGGRQVTGDQYYFITDAAAPPAKWAFAVAGDNGEEPDGGAIGATSRAMDAQTPRPDFWLMPGDIVYPDGQSSTYDRHLMTPIRDLARHTAIWPVRGNHDWHTPADFAKEWVLPAPEHYFAFEWANAVIIGIDDGDKGFGFEWTQQANLLRQTLEQHRNKDWKFVFWHVPGYTCSYKGNSGAVISNVLPILDQYDVDISFVGHAHLMEVTHPMLKDGSVVNADQRPNYISPAGTVHVVTGSGGKVDSGSSMCRNQNQFTKSVTGFTYVTIEGRKATVRMISSDNQVQYQFTITKSGGGGGTCNDADGDGYGNPPTNCQNTAADCNDNNAAIKPGATEVCGNGVDDNCNTQTDEGCQGTCVDTDGDGYGNPPTGCAHPEKDCNNNNASISPGAPEVCGNGLDDNCNARIDDGCSGCVDADRDGYGTSASASRCAVTTPDCDDTSAGRRPNATEVCGNGIDENCNPADDACVETCATDRDGDGYRAEAVCGAARDCADLNADINPGRPERCGNGLDDDCDTQTDEGCACANPPACDADCDGVVGAQCGGPDCHDGNPAIRPNASEVCGNRLDDNCDQQIDAPCPAACINPPPCDADCDGVVGLQCGGPDCHDGNAAVRPNATENCANQLDDNCNQAIDAADAACGGSACATDFDQDGYKGDAACPALARDCDDRNAAVKPGAAEVCGNGIDEDCDGRDRACDEFRCAGNVPIGSCDTYGNFCLPNRTLAFNCYVCPCPSGAACVDNECIVEGGCAQPCSANEDCQDGACVARCAPPCATSFVCEGGACVPRAVCEPNWVCGPLEPATCPRLSKVQRRICTQTNCPDQASTTTKIELCQPEDPCSNGLLDEGEDCDGDTSLLTCAAVDPGLRGELGCRPDCRFDTSKCCTTAPASGSRRGPRYPQCEEPTTVPDPGPKVGTGKNGTLPPVKPNRTTDRTETTQTAGGKDKTPWYLNPINIGLAIVILGLGFLLKRQRSLRTPK